MKGLRSTDEGTTSVHEAIGMLYSTAYTCICTQFSQSSRVGSVRSSSRECARLMLQLASHTDTHARVHTRLTAALLKPESD